LESVVAYSSSIATIIHFRLPSTNRRDCIRSGKLELRPGHPISTTTSGVSQRRRRLRAEVRSSQSVATVPPAPPGSSTASDGTISTTPSTPLDAETLLQLPPRRRNIPGQPARRARRLQRQIEAATVNVNSISVSASTTVPTIPTIYSPPWLPSPYRDYGTCPARSWFSTPTGPVVTQHARHVSPQLPPPDFLHFRPSP
jgi:hypothetical protein